MDQVSIIGLDLAKNVFQAHGADKSGHPVFSKKLPRSGVLAFFSSLPPCLVAMGVNFACRFTAGAVHFNKIV